MFKRLLASIVMALLTPVLALAQVGPVYDQASDIQTDVSDFGGNITTGATDVQKALKEINDLNIGGDSGWTDDGSVVRLTTITDNVGVGTTTPIAQLSIKSNGTTPFMVGNDVSGDMLTVTSAGNVGIGTTIPSGTLTLSPVYNDGSSSSGTVTEYVLNGVTYRVHTITQTGNSTFTAPNFAVNASVLVVGGGAGGGSGERTNGDCNTGGSGGGSGKYILDTVALNASESVTVTVGAAGLGAYYGVRSPQAGSQSVFKTLTAPGGSPGFNANGVGPAGGASGQPYSGGAGWGSSGGAGGGGSASVGGNASTYFGGAGGSGTWNTITGASVCYAGGGAGSGRDGSGAGGCGESTGGCGYSTNGSHYGQGGSGNAKRADFGLVGAGNGMQGVVIVSYPLPTMPTSLIVNGRVGINISSPESMLNIKTQGKTNGTSAVSIFDNTGAQSFKIDDAGNTYVRGTVAIGTTTPMSNLAHLSLSTAGKPVLMYSNGTPWPTTPRVVQQTSASVTSNDSTTATGPTVGLLLENSASTNAMFSPLVAWSRKSSSGNYNSVFASIGGFAVASHTDTNYVSGDLVFSTAPAATLYSPQERVRILGNGNVGIGTSSPDAKLEVQGNIEAGAGSVANPAFGFFADHDNGMYYAGTNSIGLVTGGSDRLRITSTGNVGIGSVTPRGALDVQGNIYGNGFYSGGNVGITTSGPTSCVITNIKNGLIIAGSCS